MQRLTVQAPAKLNLFLAILPPRADGFHDLVSLAAPLDWGDTLELRLRAGESVASEAQRAGQGGRTRSAGAAGRATDRLTLCGTVGASREFGEAGTTAPSALGSAWAASTTPPPAHGVAELSLAADNLVLRAAAAFRAASGFAMPVDFFLHKRVPIGAGLGGGSSDAVAALRGLNALAVRESPSCALSEAQLAALAAELGSDCTLFLSGAPAIMRGRGERVTPLATAAVARLRGQRVFLCKPAFGVNTAWAYAQMRRRGCDYVRAAAAEALAAEWAQLGADGAAGTAEVANPVNAAAGAAQRAEPEALTFNNMEAAVFAKYPVLPVLAAAFRKNFGLGLRMSGSGSACFAFLPPRASSKCEAAAGVELAEQRLVEQLRACVHELWGTTAFVHVAQIAAPENALG